MAPGSAVGVPGEDVGAADDAGTVVYSRTLGSWYSLLLEDTGAATVPAGAGFGETLAAVAA